MLERRVLARAYFTHERLVKHQIDSFNRFIEEGLQRVIDEQRIIELDIPDTYVKLGKIWVDKPIIREADGSEPPLVPSTARLRNLTYAAKIQLITQVIDEGRELDEEVVTIGMMPIMVKSEKCNLHPDNIDEALEKLRYPILSTYEEKLTLLGEDTLDPGGYFIINGSERALMTLEDLAPNKILLEKEERYGESIEIAKVFSQRSGYRALVVVERSKGDILEVSFPQLPKTIPFVTMMRALGVETDQEIVTMVSEDPEIMKFLLENLEDAEVETQEQAIELIGKKVAPGQSKEYKINRANQVIDQYFLPHLGTTPESRRAKAFFLARMAEAVLELALGLRREDDKDHYANKRLKLAGDLMEEIFRVAFLRLIKDVKYQLERAKVRGRPLKMSTAVRSDVLTDRIMHPMATGNWVRGRTGVSQLIDRHNYLSIISHLRRVISPLSRSQPHFEARDLHPTQWGRICPSETPEGPNCGLVKNFAQYAEVSVGTDEKEVISTLYELGVEPIRRV
ncbi:DNA-directed RNA polymerase, subunit B [Archaeoglobus sulfaticallidus PM70-1]|uniref:DNA-directed RNA polymerase n=1 Tax=Archaeoglobus sulfaticallidus PM70-1 TaxID=387631 RepID=N0BEM1_9EURY|nr:DNA-directed RNA polymerase subunit B'' [Archaeoglobus sulfaticallidus]AGK60722.1 DNA-directed RNA polymerase, subunit B [Archaeoglobus sulfaticallidus PM70-1]